ncbi:MAG: AraC family transcriptional regulator [Verrucomicrobiota bacterium]
MPLLQSDFLEQINSSQATRLILDLLPDTIASLKDRQGVYHFVNKAFVATLQKPANEIIGKTDSELFAPELAKIYIEDDRKLLSSGVPIQEKTELVTYRPGIVRWYITNKIPLKNKEGEIIGLAVLARPSHSNKTASTQGPMGSLSKAIDYVYQEIGEPLSVQKLSEICSTSISSLERYFKNHFGCTPGRFITQAKISTACELLANPSYTIYQIGTQTGYPDPAIFSRVFKREMRMSPTAYRKSILTSEK